MLKTARVGAIAAAVFAVYSLWLLSGWSQGRPLVIVADVFFVVLTVTATLLAARATRSMSGQLRKAWLSITVGLLGWAVGEIIWAYYEIRQRELPFPSLADVAYLVFPVGACVGLLLFPAAHSIQSRLRLLLDGVIVAGSLFLVSWVTIMRPLAEEGANSRLAFVISLTYPISDIVIVTIAAVVLVRSSGAHRLSLTLLTVGLACVAVSDSVFAYLEAKNKYASGGVIDLGWAAGLLCITVAAVAESKTRFVQRDSVALPGWASVWLPYAPLLVAGIIGAAQPVPLLQTHPVLIAAGLLVVAVLARQFLAVSENRRLLAAVAVQALHDPLTGLANRALFNERLDHAMQLREREDLSVGVVAVDLNDFKLVNDNLGHPVGDDLLVGVASRLMNCVRVGDTLARLGGDEFAIVVEGGVDAAEVVGLRVVEAFEEPFVLRGHELLIRASVGVAAAEPDEPTLEAEELLTRADAAMYVAKRSRVSGMRSYDPDIHVADMADQDLAGKPADGVRDDGVTAIQRLGKLRKAIERSELILVYQPQVDLRTGAVIGVEALLRWPQGDDGVLAPKEFLFLVRRHGLMRSVTRLVLDKALDDALSWRRAGVDLPVAVNVFAPSMTAGDLPAIIGRALAERGLEPSALSVEITEDIFLDGAHRTRAVLSQLRSSGIRIAIDDFGSGYSTLSYLRDLPIDEVKLDREFIAPIVADPRAAAVLRAVVDLAHVLGLTIVAEGVEDAETAALVREFGCDVGQGFYYSVPLTPDELVDLVGPAASASPPSA
ncbi:putative bifunctional diguanylate cyclase/phosphodiesterase [Mycolicibacterium sp. CBM1]